MRVRKDYDLDEVFSYVNEIALFKNQWQLKTASAADYMRLVEERYRPVFEELKNEIKAKDWFHPQAVYGFFPAQVDGNDVVAYHPDDLGRERLRITFPRQREGRKLSIADFFLPKNRGTWM